MRPSISMHACVHACVCIRVCACVRVPPSSTCRLPGVSGWPWGRRQSSNQLQAGGPQASTPLQSQGPVRAPLNAPPMWDSFNRGHKPHALTLEVAPPLPLVLEGPGGLRGGWTVLGTWLLCGSGLCCRHCPKAGERHTGMPQQMCQATHLQRLTR